MRLFRAAQIRELDRLAIEDLGIPGVVLMENAGRGATALLLEHLRQRHDSLSQASVVVLAGPGNNGGDGYVLARHLINAGVHVLTLLCTNPEKLQGDALIHYNILCQMVGGSVQSCLNEEELGSWRIALENCDAVVDGLLGTGLGRDLEGWFLTLVETCNQIHGPWKFALDVPSGLEADKGVPRPVCFEADCTATFAAAKTGLVMPAAQPFVGRLEIVDIGVPVHLIEEMQADATMLTEARMRPLWPSHLHPNSHKGSFGHLLVMAGSPGKSGAALLTSSTALRTGVGLCTLATDQAVATALEGRVLEVMCEALPALTDMSEVSTAQDAIPALKPTSAMEQAISDVLAAAPPSSNLATKSVPTQEDPEDTMAFMTKLMELLEGKAAFALGPGLGTSSLLGEMIALLLPQVDVPMVIDADGLNLLVEHLEVFQLRKAPTILTPHPGEMGRLVGKSSREVQAERLETASAFAIAHSVIVVLKGARTVVASPDGRCWINSTGHVGLGTAGSGDVLTGIIGALLARGFEALEAAQLGVYLHGKVADSLIATHGYAGLIASDITAHLPSVLVTWEGEHD